eukprot:TRINITY_DN15113_c0_g1_i1.p1 TRINITY_DN15113_c0_g1~~TRINITY_DN15113_c0_g1_i1.p1  ORF type:complete len:292 (-),score=82.35 TRINITY_DN15113_c0_g1_i1:2-775(-)
MLHKVKRNVAAMSTHTIENAEVQDYRQRLDGAAKALKAGLDDIASTERNWTALVGSNFVNFSDRFATSYPDADPLRDVAKETATSSLALLKAFSGRVESTTSQHKRMEALVRAYLGEIEGVEKEIKTALHAAKVELDMYAKKLEALQGKAGAARDEAKIGRNLEKFEAARAAYDDAVVAVTGRQAAVWARRAVAFRALVCRLLSSAGVGHVSVPLHPSLARLRFVEEHRDGVGGNSTLEIRTRVGLGRTETAKAHRG